VQVLVVDHTAQEGGAESAMLRVVQRIGDAEPTVRALLFEDGPFRRRLADAGVVTAVVALDSRTNRTSRDRVLSPLGILGTVAATIGFVPRLARAIRGSGCDLVAANSLKSAVFVSLAAPLAGRRWVWHLHDRLAADYLPRPLVVLMRALAVVGPRRIVANSRATLATLPARARRKTSVAYPGLPSDAFADPGNDTAPPDTAPPDTAPPDTAPPDTALPDGAAAEVVTLIGRISPTKGQHEFLAAAAELARRRPTVRFVVVGAALFGEDEYASGLAGHAHALGIAERVEFTGWVSNPGTYLRSSTVLVHASPVPEPFGQVVAEAMAAGIPVVAADAGGVREMLDPDPAAERGAVCVTGLGVLVRPGDAAALADGIAHVLEDRDAAARRARAARDAASARFRIDDTAAVIRGVWRAAAPR